MNKIHQKLIENIKPEHNWNADDPHPDTRCRKCGIKKSYYYNAISTMKSWIDEDIDAEPSEVWQGKIASLSRCPNS